MRETEIERQIGYRIYMEIVETVIDTGRWGYRDDGPCVKGQREPRRMTRTEFTEFNDLVRCASPIDLLSCQSANNLSVHSTDPLPPLSTYSEDRLKSFERGISPLFPTGIGERF